MWIFKFKIKTMVAFTLIEMLISVSIMLIIWVFWIWFLQMFFVKYDIQSIAKKIDNKFNNLDSEIKFWLNDSYELEINSESLWFILNKHFLKKADSMYLNNFDFLNASWTITTSNTSTWTWFTNFYANNKFQTTYIRSWSWDLINFSFSWSKNYLYKISSMIDSKPINEYEIIYYAIDNLNNEDSKKVQLVSLSWAQLYDKIKIKNVLWKKEILWFTGTTFSWFTDSVFLNFERWWQDFQLELKN